MNETLKEKIDEKRGIKERRGMNRVYREHDIPLYI